MYRLFVNAALAVAAALALACSAAGGKSDDTAVTCDPGWHACGPGQNDCAPDSSPYTCGTRCTPCPTDPHGESTCVAGACGITCDDGHHLCAGACVDDGSKDACGPSCLPCPAPAYAHARAACIADQCDYTCELGFLRCAAGCCTAPEAGFPRLACGAVHTCAITSAGVPKCWGANGWGQVGNDSTTDSLVPVVVTGSEAGTAVQVSAGWEHSCGVDGTGGAWCWGQGWAGQLGNGTFGPTNHSTVPVEVNVAGAEALTTSVGWAHSCALFDSGAVKCWGNNESGQLGTGTLQGSGTPTSATLADLAYGVRVGWKFSCAVTGPASLSCWGDNAYGQLGNPDKGAVELAPVPVTNVADVTVLRAVAVGYTHVCVAYDKEGVAGAVRCWGRGDSGQLGNGATPSVQKAGVEVIVDAGTALLDVVALAAGDAHTCAITASGALLCWGANSGGQLGVGAGDYTQRSRATAVFSLDSNVGRVSAGGEHTCALVGVGTDSEALWCWGQNGRGQLGDGTKYLHATPVEITGF